MGIGLGLAIGAKAARPDQPVLCVTGDGSAGFTLGDIETALRFGAPYVAVVAHDGAWGIEADSRPEARRQGTTLGEIRFDRQLRAKKPWAVAGAAALLVSISAVALSFNLEYQAYGNPLVVDAVGNGTRHPVTVRIPPRPQMPDEARLVGRRHDLPDILHEGPKRIDNWLPASA